MPDRVFRMNLNLRQATNYSGNGAGMWWKADYKIPNAQFLPWHDGYTMVKVLSVAMRLNQNGPLPNGAGRLEAKDRSLAIRIPQFASDSYDSNTMNGNATLFKFTFMGKLLSASDMDAAGVSGADWVSCDNNTDPYNYITVPTTQINSLNKITINIVNGMTGIQDPTFGPFLADTSPALTQTPTAADVAVELIFMKADDKF